MESATIDTVDLNDSTGEIVQSKKTNTITLCMIVKDESHVIERCLSSVAPLVDYWVIVDTGSTDGTQQKIKDFFDRNGIPGELHEIPWVDFGTNRSKALELAQSTVYDYSLMIDADEYKFDFPSEYVLN